MSQENSILILFGSDSRLRWGRSYRLARAFQKTGNETFYVDLPDPLLRRASLFDRERIEISEEGFPVFRPRFALPVGRFPFFMALNDELLRRQLESALERVGFRPTILWVYGIYSPQVIRWLQGKFNPRSTVYDCADERVGMALQANGAKAARRVEDLETRVMRLSDTVFCVSRSLCELKSKKHPNVKFLPNGVDLDIFAPDEEEVPPEYIDLPGKKIAYIGSMQYWFDMELALSCARSYPEDSFIFVGPVHIDISKLADLPNVHIFGEKDFDKVKQYIKGTDILFNPVLDVDNIKYCNSMKILQYLAMGKRVVSMSFNKSNELEGLIKLAGDPKEFVRLLGESFECEGELERKRVSFMENYDWTVIARKGLELLALSDPQAQRGRALDVRKAVPEQDRSLPHLCGGKAEHGVIDPRRYPGVE
jgi:glycosyltransferase involved in cell wall biosynthesis